MSAPVPVTDDISASGIRTHTAYDLEKTLVSFIEQIFADAYRLDNPAVNRLQATRVENPILPPEPSVPYDYTERAQTLEGKVAPTVERGRVPRTVTGELDLDKLPDFPHIIVQAVKAKVHTDDTHVTVKILVGAYDENPDGGGYQDVLNMIEAVAIAITSYGQAGIDQAYPIVLPFTWMIVEANTFPHFLGELETVWQLPSGRPMPDDPRVTLGDVPTYGDI